MGRCLLVATWNPVVVRYANHCGAHQISEEGVHGEACNAHRSSNSARRRPELRLLVCRLAAWLRGVRSGAIRFELDHAIGDFVWNFVDPKPKPCKLAWAVKQVTQASSGSKSPAGDFVLSSLPSNMSSHEHSPPGTQNQNDAQLLLHAPTPALPAHQQSAKQHASRTSTMQT